MSDLQHSDDLQFQGKPVKTWKVIEKPCPFGSALKKLRIRVTYPDGSEKLLAPSFADRSSDLNKYVARFHRDFTGKEDVSD